MKAKIMAVAMGGLLVAITATTALAGHQESGVKSYTGCLVSGDGGMIKIKEGNAPRSACTGGQVQAHFSGGDITKISVNGGLTMPGGATSDENGEVTIALDASYSLPQGCAAGRVAKWNGTAWTCGLDNDTTYSAGTGLDLSAGNEFSIEPAYRVKNTPDCPSGEFAIGFESDGTIRCEPSAAAGDSRSIHVPSYTFTGPDFEKLVAVTLPQGVWTLTSRADLKWSGGSDEFFVSVACELRAGSTVLAGSEDEEWVEEDSGGFVANPRGRATLTVIDVESAPAAGKEISLWCKNSGGTVGDLGSYGADLVAAKVD
jgi:hypothetical protein